MKVLKKKKVHKMKTTTAVVNPASQQIPPDNTEPTYCRTTIGEIFYWTRELIVNPPKIGLARAISQRAKAPTSISVNTDGSVDHADYVAFCKSKHVKPRTFRVCDDQDEKTYNHYAAYCAAIVAKPHTIEYWDEPRIKAQLRSFKGSNGTLGKDVEPNYKKEEQDRGFYVCEAPTGEPDCLTQPLERPITFDKHLARAAYRPSLLEVNKTELTPAMVLNNRFGLWNKFDYRNRVKVASIVNRKFKDPVATTPHASLMCVKCGEYDAQPHWQNVTKVDKGGRVDRCFGCGCYFRIPQNTVYEERLYQCPVKIIPVTYSEKRPINLGFYPANDPLTIEWKARQLWFATKLRSKREHLQRFLEYMNLNSILRHKPAWIRKQAVSLLRTPAWVVSLEGDITHVERSTLTDLVVAREIVVPACCNGNDHLGVHPGADQRSASIIKNERQRRCTEAIVVDYLPVPRCRHPLLKSFAFRDGETIEMCTDCATLDARRRAVLMSGSVVRATQGAIALHDALLKTYNLSMDRGMFHKSLLWGSLNDISGRVEELTNSYSHRVNTAGSVGTDHDGEGHDSNARDRRAKQWFAEQQGKEPLTESMCQCCGAQIFDRVGVVFCPDTDCRQRFQDVWPTLNKEYSNFVNSMERGEVVIERDEDRKRYEFIVRTFITIKQNRS